MYMYVLQGFFRVFVILQKNHKTQVNILRKGNVLNDEISRKTFGQK